MPRSCPALQRLELEPKVGAQSSGGKVFETQCLSTSS